MENKFFLQKKKKIKPHLQYMTILRQDRITPPFALWRWKCEEAVPPRETLVTYLMLPSQISHFSLEWHEEALCYICEATFIIIIDRFIALWENPVLHYRTFFEGNISNLNVMCLIAEL